MGKKFRAATLKACPSKNFNVEKNWDSVVFALIFSEFGYVTDFFYVPNFFHVFLKNQGKNDRVPSVFKKGNRILRYGCRSFDTFWVPDDIKSCNFQNLIVFGFRETSQNLTSFRQVLFSLFHRGDQRKKSENPKMCQMSGIHI